MSVRTSMPLANWLLWGQGGRCLAKHESREPLRILFVYQFLSLGGVEVVLRGRLEELIRRGIPARCVFLETGDGMSLFEDLTEHIDVCKTEGDLQRAITAFGPDIIATIDTPTVVPVAHQFAPGAKL